MFEDLDIDLGGQWIRGKLWGPAAGLPTIALHGYLDNANSFDALAPRLLNHRIFAMDFAGHGASDHRRPHELYSGLLDIRDVLAVADHFGWSRFHLIGHSMGAEIGSQIAGLFPDRVASLVCIDGFCSTNVVPVTLEHLASSVSASFKQSARLKVFPNLAAMSTRLSDATGQSSASAEAIVARGHAEADGGYTWRTDPRIKGSGPLELTGEQLQQLIQQITAETLMIVADLSNDWLQRSLDVVMATEQPLLTVVHVPGHHHLHMQAESASIAALIERFAAGEALESKALSPDRYRQLTDAVNKTGG
ncbi:MAG: alpha/beta hydrolase [Pseudomonadales bacterium]|nr:alpha/beta hydrolase [Pseudomonadales bacterium]